MYTHICELVKWLSMATSNACFVGGMDSHWANMNMNDLTPKTLANNINNRNNNNSFNDRQLQSFTNYKFGMLSSGST